MWYAALQLQHFNSLVTKLANYDDLVAKRDCVILGDGNPTDGRQCRNILITFVQPW